MPDPAQMDRTAGPPPWPGKGLLHECHALAGILAPRIARSYRRRDRQSRMPARSGRTGCCRSVSVSRRSFKPERGPILARRV